MCGLCGVLGSEDHWSEGLIRQSPSSAEPWVRRQARLRSIALADAVTAHRRCRIQGWQGAITISGPTGRIEIARGLSDLWPKVEAVTGPLDPLDEELLAQLE